MLHVQVPVEREEGLQDRIEIELLVRILQERAIALATATAVAQLIALPPSTLAAEVHLSFESLVIPYIDAIYSRLATQKLINENICQN